MHRGDCHLDYQLIQPCEVHRGKTARCCIAVATVMRRGLTGLVAANVSMALDCVLEGSALRCVPRHDRLLPVAVPHCPMIEALAFCG